MSERLSDAIDLRMQELMMKCWSAGLNVAIEKAFVDDLETIDGALELATELSSRLLPDGYVAVKRDYVEREVRSWDMGYFGHEPDWEQSASDIEMLRAALTLTPPTPDGQGEGEGR